jgi:hypothetical protein
MWKTLEAMPLFSVVIPAYNCVDWIAAALESVFSQTFKNFEAIVVDDGSTDGTREVLERYANHLRLIRQKNRGPGAARNRGIREASGRYVAFLDSDDIWFPWTLEIFSLAISRYSDSTWLLGLPVMFSDPVKLREVHCDTAQFVWYNDFYSFLSEERHTVFHGACVAVCKTNVLRTVGGFVENERNAEDTDLFMRTGRRPGFVRITSPVTLAHRQHQQSLTENIRGLCRGVRFLVEQDKCGVYPDDPSSRRERTRAIAWRGRKYSIKCVKSTRFDLGLKLYRLTLRYQLRNRQFRYIAGYPVLAAMTWLMRAAIWSKSL